jgi:hypothetical protein
MYSTISILNSFKLLCCNFVFLIGKKDLTKELH